MVKSDSKQKEEQADKHGARAQQQRTNPKKKEGEHKREPQAKDRNTAGYAKLLAANPKEIISTSHRNSD